MPDVNTPPELTLIPLALGVARAPTLAEACRTAAESLADALGCPCLIQIQPEHDLPCEAASVAWADSMRQAATSIPLELPQARADLFIAEGRQGRGTSAGGTGAGRRAGRQAAAVEDPAWREALASVLAGAFQLVHFRAAHARAAERLDEARRFSQALLGIADSAALHRTIVETMARAAGAEIGALAVFQPQENSLAITATHGYPAVLVEHVRVAPGEGVLGRVFATGERILATNLSAVPGQVSRRRYRTDSFVALPLAAPDGVVAVLSLTDKASGAPFTSGDVDMLEMLAAPAALALARELLRDRSNDFAHLATVDPLTGLFNRRFFEKRLEQEIQRQRRQAEDLSLLMLDLDNFKELNDSQGHLVGDVALREVAEILRRAVRIFDICGRYGGEEFVILMPGAGATTAIGIAERIRRQVEQHFATSRRSGVPVPVTVSIGVSTAVPNITRDALIAQADAALLRAKSAGKNLVNVHDVPASP